MWAPANCSPFWGAEGQTWRRSRSEASGTSATPGASRPSSGASISPSRSTRGSSFRPRCVPYACHSRVATSKSQVPPSIDAGCAVQLRLRRRAQRRYQPTGTIVGRATIPRAARERPEDGLRSRTGARAVRAGQHRGPSWGRSELRRRRVTVQAGRRAGGARCGIRGVRTAVLRGDVARARASGREGAGCHVVNRIAIIVPSQVSLFLSSYGQLD